LMVDTDPRFLHAIHPGKSGLLKQEPGRLILRWTPTDVLRGATFNAQMVWASPANDRGYLFSPLLRITVE